MRWSSVYIQNFLSITEAKVELDKRGLVLIEGKNLTSNKFKSNGSGKSSLMDSIVYGIYDTTSKGLSADDVVNNKVGKNTAVILEGYKGEDLYRIERYRKHTKNKNKVKLFCNDREITGKSAKETNKMIEQIVGTDYNTFVNSIMFSQGNGAGRFALATDKEKKEILEGLVNMEVYSKAQDVAKEWLKAKEAEIIEKKREGERLNWELSQVDTLEQQDQQNYEHIKNTITQEQLRMGKVIEEMHNFAAQNHPQIEQEKEEIVQLKEKSETMINLNIESYMMDSNQAGRAVQENKTAQDQLNREKARLVNEYKKVESSVNCPICGNLLDPVHREQEMNNIKEQLKQVLLSLQPLTQALPALEEEFNKAYAIYSEKKAIYDTNNTAYRAVLGEIQTKEQRVQWYYQTHQGYKDEVERIKRTLETFKEHKEPKPRDKDREAIQGKIAAQKEELLQLEREKKELEDAVKVYSNSGVKSHVLDLITPFLNERANKHLAILSGPDMEVKFSTQTRNKDNTVSDKFDLQLVNAAGGDNYKANSEGEKKRADLSISLAIQDLVMSKSDSESNFVVYDEVFDALDEIGCENVVTLLRERLDIVGTIFVITHSEHLKALFEKVITVIKDKNGTSTIIEREGDGTT